jgi:hypothetical protein
MNGILKNSCTCLYKSRSRVRHSEVEIGLSSLICLSNRMFTWNSSTNTSRLLWSIWWIEVWRSFTKILYSLGKILLYSKEVTKHSFFTLKRVVHWDVTLPRDTQIGVDSVMNMLLPSELFSLRMAVKSCSYMTNSELMQIFCRAQTLKLIHGRSEVLRLSALETEVFWGVRPVK